MSEAINRVYKVIGLGQAVENSHPIHPILVHFPIAFLSLADFLHILYATSLYLSLPFTPDAANLSALSIFSYASNFLGILTAIPAIITGFAELQALISSHGWWEIDPKTGQKHLIPKVKIALLHCALMDITVFLAVLNWRNERKAPDFSPKTLQLVLSTVSLFTLLYGAYLGGKLVYQFGAGLQRQGKGVHEKAKQKK